LIADVFVNQLLARGAPDRSLLITARRRSSPGKLARFVVAFHLSFHNTREVWFNSTAVLASQLWTMVPRAPEDGTRRERKKSFATLLFLPAPLHSAVLRTFSPCILGEQELPFAFTEYRLTPHYPVKSPVDDLLRYVVPGSDEYVSERYATEIARLLDQCLKELRTYLAPLGQVLTAEFEIVHIEQTASSPITVRIEIHYDLVGVQEDEDKGREERIGNWLTELSHLGTSGPVKCFGIIRGC
jgi:hypothetical protein